MRRIIAVLFIPLFLGSCRPTSKEIPFSTTEFVVDIGEISRPTVAVNQSDKVAYWAWIRKDGDGWNTYVARYDHGSGLLSEPVRVNHLEGNASPHDQAPAQVITGADGSVVVVWTNSSFMEGRRFPSSNLLYSRSTDRGLTFSPEQAINSDANDDPSGHTFHNVLALPDGTILVSWIDSRARDRQVIDAIDSSVNAGGRPGGSEIWIARSVDNGSSFEESFVADHNACPCCRTTMAAGPDGEVYLAWRHEFDDGARDIVLSRSDDAGLSFSEPTRVWNDHWVISACPHAGPSVGVDGDGTVHVSWFTGVETGIGLFRAVSNDRGKTFKDKVLLDSGGGIASATFASISSGRFGVVYERSDARTLELLSISSADVSRPLLPSMNGRKPSFSGGDGLSSLVYEKSDSVIAHVIWTED